MRPLGAAARHVVDVDAELARHPAHRRRRGRRRQIGGGGRLRRRPLAATDVDDFLRRPPPAQQAACLWAAVAPVRGLAAAGGPFAAFLRRLAAFSGLLRRRRRWPRAPPSTLRIAWPTFTLSPALTLTSFTAGDRRGHFDRRLVGFELEDRLIFGDRVARLDQHAQHVAARDVLAELGKREVSRHEDSGRSYEIAGLAFSGLMLCALIACSTTDASILPSRASAASVATTT